MPNSITLNQTQREEFKQSLRTLLEKARNVLSEKSAEAHRSALDKTVESCGLAEVIDRYVQMTAAVEILDNTITEKGFRISHDGTVDIDRSNDETRGIYNAFLNGQVGTEAERVKQIEEAMRSAWSVESLSEAKQVIASFAQ